MDLVGKVHPLVLAEKSLEILGDTTQGGLEINMIVISLGWGELVLVMVPQLVTPISSTGGQHSDARRIFSDSQSKLPSDDTGGDGARTIWHHAT